MTMSNNGEINDASERLLRYEKMFNDSFKDIVNELVEKDEANSEIEIAANWLRQALDYNSFDGKKSRGKMVIRTVECLRHGHPTEEELRKAIYLGWCVEILQAVFLVADDVMDRSEMRRGKPCWYKKTGLRAVNEMFLMQQCIYKLIDAHFQKESYLPDLYKAFHLTTYLTAMGEGLDMIISDAPEGTFSLNSFTMENYKSIVKYKTAYYSFYLPVSLGMYIVQVQDSELYKEVESVLLRLGELFQIQDDYLDCYGDPAITGKVGRDIEDGKCSWLVVQALQMVTDEENVIVKNNYGVDDKMAVEVVKQLYTKLNLSQLFEEYERKTFEDICQSIRTHRAAFPKDLCLLLAEKMYRRKK